MSYEKKVAFVVGGKGMAMSVSRAHWKPYVVVSRHS